MAKDIHDSPAASTKQLECLRHHIGGRQRNFSEAARKNGLELRSLSLKLCRFLDRRKIAGYQFETRAQNVPRLDEQVSLLAKAEKQVL
jgi:hypothetical protein